MCLGLHVKLFGYTFTASLTTTKTNKMKAQEILTLNNLQELVSEAIADRCIEEQTCLYVMNSKKGVKFQTDKRRKQDQLSYQGWVLCVDRLSDLLPEETPEDAEDCVELATKVVDYMKSL